MKKRYHLEAAWKSRKEPWGSVTVQERPDLLRSAHVEIHLGHARALFGLMELIVQTGGVSGLGLSHRASHVMEVGKPALGLPPRKSLDFFDLGSHGVQKAPGLIVPQVILVALAFLVANNDEIRGPDYAVAAVPNADKIIMKSVRPAAHKEPPVIIRSFRDL
jgi:hypothetical protein